METEFINKCDILSELWMNYRDEESFKDFFQYNDVGLPLAFAISEGIIDTPTETAKSFVNEAFIIFLEILSTKDSGFESLNDILKISGYE